MSHLWLHKMLSGLSLQKELLLTTCCASVWLVTDRLSPFGGFWGRRSWLSFTIHIPSFWKPHPGISLRLASSSWQSVTNSELEVNRQQMTVDLNDLSSPKVRPRWAGNPGRWWRITFFLKAKPWVHVALPPLVSYWASKSVIGLFPGSSLSPPPTHLPFFLKGKWDLVSVASHIMKSRVCPEFDALKPSRVYVEGCMEY